MQVGGNSSRARHHQKGQRMRSCFLALFLLFGAAGSANAARPIEKREKADLVFTGVVERVFIRDKEGCKDYVVEMRVEAVERGTGLAPRDTFRAFCYQCKPADSKHPFRDAGHKAVP